MQKNLTNFADIEHGPQNFKTEAETSELQQNPAQIWPKTTTSGVEG
jgi:hypothetical protein